MCPICSHTDVRLIFRKKEMPCYNLERHQTVGSARGARVGAIDFHICAKCGAAFNRAFDQKFMDYAVDYENSRSISPRYRAYLNETALLLAPHASRVGTIVEVGCGAGDFLAELRAHTRAVLYGFDPALPPNLAPGAIMYRKDYYRDGVLSETPEMIVLRHVLEHQKDPYAFLAPLLPGATAKRPLLYIEVPAWEWIVRRRSFYAFSYEHVTYYSESALRTMLARLGYRTLLCRFTFDEEYLACVAAPDEHATATVKETGSLLDESLSFARAIPEYFAMIRKHFTPDAALWGAAGKGTTLLNLLDLYAEEFPFVADSNPRRAHTFIPRTAQEVLPGDELATRRPSHILLTNSGYEREIKQQLHALGAHPSFVGLDQLLAKRT